MCHLLRSGFEIVLEGTIEILEHALPVEMLFLDLVKLLFHVPGKGDVHDPREVVAELVGDNFT